MTEPLSLNKAGFLIMPFSPELKWIDELVRRSAAGCGVTMLRADDIFAADVILDQILTSIDNADIVVAVCTGRNPNVFFELGYAWRVHRPVLIAEETNDLPFDVAHYRTLLYGRPNEGQGPDTLGARLSRAINETLAQGRPLPKGQRLTAAPSQKEQASLRARAQPTGGNNGEVVITNTGNINFTGVDLAIPSEENEHFKLWREGLLPIAILRPGESVPVGYITMMGPAKIIESTVFGNTSDDERHEFPFKMTLK